MQMEKRLKICFILKVWYNRLIQLSNQAIPSVEVSKAFDHGSNPCGTAIPFLKNKKVGYLTVPDL